MSLVSSLVSLVSFLGLVRDRTREAAHTAAPRARLPVNLLALPGRRLPVRPGRLLSHFAGAPRCARLGPDAGATVTAVPLAVLLYALHNGASAVAALGAGHLGDRHRKVVVLAVGYGIGMGTNVFLTTGSTSVFSLTLAVLFSGVYIAIEETIEKAAAAEMLPCQLQPSSEWARRDRNLLAIACVGTPSRRRRAPDCSPQLSRAASQLRCTLLLASTAPCSPSFPGGRADHTHGQLSIFEPSDRSSSAFNLIDPLVNWNSAPLGVQKRTRWRRSIRGIPGQCQTGSFPGATRPLVSG